MAVVYLGLGSNLGDRKKYLIDALEELQQAGLAIDTVASLYVSRALWFEGAEFYNTVARLSTKLDPYQLLTVVQAVEEKMGRMRSAEGYADRTLDIDILLYDDMVFSASDLTIPHRAIGQRDFVLAPLVSIDANVMDPMFDQEFAAVLEALPEEQRTILEVIHGWYEVPVIK